MIYIRPRRRKKNSIKVRVFYPSTEEGMKELKDSLAIVMLDILEKQLGPEKLDQLMEYAKSKTDGNKYL